MGGWRSELSPRKDQTKTKICSQYIRHLMPFCHYIIYSIYPTGSNQRSVMLRLPNRLPPNKGKPEEVDFSHICFYICTYSYYVYIPVMWRLPNRLLLTKGKRGKWISFTFFCQYTYFWGILCMYVCSYICQSFSSFVLDIFSNKLKTFTLAEGDV